MWLSIGTVKLENPEKRRRKGNISLTHSYSETKASTRTKMASSTAKSSSHEKKQKDSPSLSNQSAGGPGGSNPTFTPGQTLFGAPTYFPATNPWQTDQSNKLDFIMEKLTKIERNQNSFLVRLGDIENKIVETNQKVVEVENSQSHLSHKFDDISSTTNENKSDIHRIQVEFKSLTDKNKTLADQNAKLKDDVIDLKCRSMRDNLLFFGIPEAVAPEYVAEDRVMEHSSEQADHDQPPGTEGAEALQLSQNSASSTSYANVVKREEDCAEKVYEFCEKVLKIDQPRSCIKIDRAHRIGVRSVGKIRPIVAKFALSEHKSLVKAALSKIDLKQAPYNGMYRVNDQFPPEVNDRRRELIPRLISERRKGNKAVLVRDKLFVNNRLVE